ncbi:hypothetical protein ABE47_17885 [Bacillus thuringiensis]|nr:hypothetical protein [Bacillus thuringiensis]
MNTNVSNVGNQVSCMLNHRATYFQLKKICIGKFLLLYQLLEGFFLNFCESVRISMTRWGTSVIKKDN